MKTSSHLDRAARPVLELARAAVRRIPPTRRARATRVVRPVFERVEQLVSRPELRRVERDLRRSIAADPHDATAWLGLGRSLNARGQTRSATRAFITAAERGAPLDVVTMMLVLYPPLWRRASSPRNVDRMRNIAAGDSPSSDEQLAVGSFLLDQGLVDEGRALVEAAWSRLLVDRGVVRSASDPWPERTGPDFLVLGPAKTGSTSLYAFLADHPRVVATPRKELHFWNSRHGRPAACYDAYFPRHLPPGFITGEATVATLTALDSVHEIAERYPALKTIVLHREPVARLYSDYQMRLRNQQEPRPLDVVVDYELRRLGPVPPLEPSDPAVRLPPGAMYCLRSCILPYLRAWVDALGPDRVMVVSSAALSAERQTTLDAIHDFLGLPRTDVRLHADRNTQSYDPIPTPVADRLGEWFAPHESALADYLAALPHVVAPPRADRAGTVS